MSETELDQPVLEYDWREPVLYMELLLDGEVIKPEAARWIHDRVLNREQARARDYEEQYSQPQVVEGYALQPAHDEYGPPQYGEPPIVGDVSPDDTLVPMQ